MIAPVETIPKLLLPPADAAEALSVCEKTLWSLTSPRGPIPCVRFGKAVRYSPAALQAWISEQEATQ